ncbi:flagellar biosynthetic protein FliQ [Hahella chejuensis KCTC 2396]|uniref:Flagellar biosynthetic protein FliQ n=1 Tax=Hahella chejuensis (strain KCTC 2396) TaxID=349521 RepID=Q2SEX1_HAHCH|nr:flagellar biosynthesis protein FliQ [Hahella chejuensis]ABC30803.1 flagellar biosynthetic protein FliQ [Hahella chejuensis KCTC 2396]
MNADLAMMLTEDMLWTAVLVAAPILIVSLVVGLIISILQVVTQIQEMTLTFVPKIGAVVAIIFVMGSWMLATLTLYAKNVIGNIPAYF